jgi:cell division protein FtsQ
VVVWRAPRCRESWRRLQAFELVATARQPAIARGTELQDTGTDADIWRRATGSPTPRPLVRRPRPAQIVPSIATRTIPKLAVPVLAAAAGLMAMLGLIGVGRPATRAAAMAGLERLAESAGFGLQQIAITGQRFTPDGDIFDALDLSNARTLLGFDNRAAQRRIEALPWVERASMERVFPDRLDIHIVEREAFAVWQTDGQYFLIDRTGRRLAALPARALPALRRVAGEGADVSAAPLFAALAAYPELVRRLEVAERVGGRRWTLRLSGAAAILLPADAGDATLARAAALVAAGYAGPGGSIDLRVADRTVLRAHAGAPTTPGGS